jgi:hypothetical protein
MNDCGWKAEADVALLLESMLSLYSSLRSSSSPLPHEFLLLSSLHIPKELKRAAK